MVAFVQEDFLEFIVRRVAAIFVLERSVGIDGIHKMMKN